jgi:DNA-binding LacI/PurR family transcriptional regulator
MTNIFDVAEAAGLSKSTVSRVFSGKGYVSDISRQKILRAADDLGYVPSILARQLRQQSTKTIGFIAKTYYPAVGDLMNYVTHMLDKKGYKINIYFTKTKEDELEILNAFKYHTLDGLFFVANRNSWHTIKKFSEYGPISTWRRINSRYVYSSYIDHYPLYCKILKYVTDTYGDVSVGHILNDQLKNNTKARLRALNEFKTEWKNLDSWKVFYPEQTDAGKDAAQKYMKLSKKPQVIVVYSDYVASEFISYLRENNYKVPEDIKVFGFDNSDFGRFNELSTIDTFLSLQVRNSIDKILSELEQTEFHEYKIVPKIIIRNTC